MTSAPTVLRLAECRELALVGGKAINLGRLIQAGFTVPDGFVVTTAAFHQCPDGRMSPAVAQDVAAAYLRMGRPVVAVRSSATAEDMADASMAGQYETFLDIEGEDDVLRAVEKCWASIRSERIVAYLKQHNIDPSVVGMAVVVQRLVPSDVAGVLFTANPRTGSRQEMLLEASWGLGEAVVSGAVQPDTLVLDRATGRVLLSTISDKQVWFPPGSRDHSQPVPADKRLSPCLKAQHVHELWHLGLRVMEHFGGEQDIEWGIHNDKLYLLQSRSVTTLSQAEAFENCLQSTRTFLRDALAAGRGEWVRHNISETLPHPTPLTWSVIRRFMSGDGGFGAMYRQLGFEPSQQVRQDGFLDLVAGRIYMDLSRGAGMFFESFPYRYDMDLLRSNPDASQGPPTVPAGSLLQQFGIGRRLARINARIEKLSDGYDREFDNELAPALAQYVREQKAIDLQALSLPQWLELWAQREKKVMDEFAPQSLLPSLIAAFAADNLRQLIEEHEWDSDSLALTNLLLAGAAPDQTLAANQALWELAHEKIDMDSWLGRFGHRAPEEFDLAAPRWRQRPEALLALAQQLRGSASPTSLHHARAEQADKRLQDLQRRLGRGARRELGRRLCVARRYIRFREDGKHFLMLGYDLLRDLALEAGRRLGVGEEVFLLSFEELRDALATGFAPLHLIEQRRIERAAQARAVLGHVIGRDDIDTLGLPPALSGEGRLRAFAISGGRCTGPVRIVHSPHHAGNLGKGYVLVCPSTDPSWTPLFVNAAALVIECGGTLSHGAVVAREMGIPAVVCASATQLLKDGEEVAIDGDAGWIVRQTGADQPVQPVPADDPEDTHIPRELVPPAAGGRERGSATLRNVFAGIWAAYFAAVFLLPGTWLYDRTMDILDAVLWPAVALWGKQGAVAAIAGALGVITMFGQVLLTDNRRLRVASKRAKALRKQSAGLPAGSPRAKAMLALAAPVQTRVLLAAFVPLAVVLGPMVMSFLWLPARVDPSSWNPPPGARLNVSAVVSGEFTGPVTLSQDPSLKAPASQSPSQSLPPIRQVLQARREAWQRQRADLSSLPWELRQAAQQTRKALLDSLNNYLRRDIPAQTLTWSLQTPPVKGKYPIKVAAEGFEPLCIEAVVGDAAPPPLKDDPGDGKPVQLVRAPDAANPVQLVTLSYGFDRTKGDDVFWSPLGGITAQGESYGWNWDAGWLVLYIAVYLPVMLMLRWVLRIP